jgi:DNA invertase Pin-like site-specific DNA recombinase
MEKRVLAYLRVSTTEQVGGMESQERVIRTYCEQNNIKNVEFFSDHGISGTKSSRPALDRMMALVEAREASTVIVYSFSRFARSTTHLLNALTRFKATNTAFVSLTERIDTNSAVGVAIFSILASIAQLERDLISDRVKIGLANARKKLRDSDLIRKLIKSGLTYRAVSSIAKCSHGSVSSEVAEMKREAAELKKKLEEQVDAEKKLLELGMAFPEIPKASILPS